MPGRDHEQVFTPRSIVAPYTSPQPFIVIQYDSIKLVRAMHIALTLTITQTPTLIYP